MFIPARLYQEELLDAGAGTDDDVVRNLSDLRRVNRWLGGRRVVLEALADQLGSETNSASILDVGTGSADIPQSVCERYASRDFELFTVGLDISERNLRLATTRLGVARSVDLVRGDSLAPPFADASFDFVTASMFLHHFQNEDAVKLLGTFARIARRAVIINDLARHLVPYYFTRLTGPFLTTSFLTRNDAPVSVLRGFTAAELRLLASEAGLRRVEVRRRFPYRLLMIARVED
jgi:ubiquinone/menaquinone biosynthesis C-methylase UbiE